MKPLFIASCLLPCVVLITGCGSSSDTTQQESAVESQPSTPAPPPTPPQPTAAVETRTDTIAALHQQQAQEIEPPPKASRVLEGQYSVQVGAYRKAANATARENLARTRFDLPATSEYSEKLSVYRVRVGAFRSFREAVAFRDKIRDAYPGEFGDAWIVNTKKEHE